MIASRFFALRRARALSDQRRRELRLSLAILTSFASKGAGFFAQVFMLPIVVAGLGQTRYAAYLALVALVAWTGPLGFGLLPALTRQLADVAAKGNVTVEARLVAAGFWVCLTLGGVLAVFTVVVSLIADIGLLAGVGPSVPADEMTLGFAASMGVMSLHFFATLSSAVRAGYQENYITNIISLVANVIVVIGLVLVRHHHSSIAVYILLAYAPFTIVYLLDVGAIFIQRRRLWPPRLLNWQSIIHGDVRVLFNTSGATWAVQVHYFLTVFGTVLLVSHLSGAADTASFGSLMRATVLFSSVLSLFIWPIVPALSDATSRGDVRWVQKCYLLLLLASMAGAVVAATILVLAGPPLFHFWLGPSVNPSVAMCAGFGAYFVGATFNLVNFNVLLAIGGAKGVGRSYLLEAALIYVVGLVLMRWAGAAGVGWALAIAAFGVNGWLLPVKARRRLRQLRAEAASM